MKILVFSDSHLYLPFDERKFNFLKSIIASCDRVIINGDFYDSYMNAFDEFVNSSWSRLFPLLKARKTVYIYGNHDQRSFSDNRVSLFSDIQAERYKIKTDKKTYIFEHGHKTRITPDAKFKISWSTKHNAMIVVHFLRNIAIKIFGYFGVLLLFKYKNKISKKMIRNFYKPKDNEIYIIGHNHFGEIDEINHYVSNGAILYGFAQYLTIENDKIQLHEKWY
ncbi:MAG: hypothetical protein UR68_C0011G0006 [Candidatus Roizmanbacteria bacterium GW2011_GWA2_35_19]|uniref:Calcineurin-like phosphoesterase domain-containing protein n=2 Tax=Candidatus Roizmaniibacteriota TaxID=1752723 RepID=A0A0G0C9Q6_9BACT|nr:MAG: hypothetical protein UR63_C0017G0006 [Candidatus Roizmanbacteria bacterium GW2011_GWC2_35_12]KKP72871.1 MAG: hypothetical protein UR68_C0011G0006 [Candidatus Roizmanbacteria bacterium GW2011_GWA2_35_19]